MDIAFKWIGGTVAVVLLNIVWYFNMDHSTKKCVSAVVLISYGFYLVVKTADCDRGDRVRLTT